MKKDLLSFGGFDKKDFYAVFDLAAKLKRERGKGDFKPLAGKSIGMIFAKASTRTRVSFEVGIAELGGNSLYLEEGKMQTGRGETKGDTARVLSRYLHGIVIRTYEQSDLEELGKYGSIPVINALTDDFHPCQILADLMTIREHKGRLNGLKLCFIGDGFNMANSLIVGGLKTGMSVSVATPSGYRPHEDVLSFAKGYDAFTLTTDPLAAAKDADVVITDVWSSMGQEQEAADRQAAFANFQVNAHLLSLAAPDAMVQHCLPAHKGEEITADAFESHIGEILDEAENRLHAQKAVLVKLLGKK